MLKELMSCSITEFAWVLNERCCFFSSLIISNAIFSSPQTGKELIDFLYFTKGKEFLQFY